MATSPQVHARLVPTARNLRRVRHGTFVPQGHTVEPQAPYQPLAISTLPAGTGYARPFFHVHNPVTVSSSAVEVMTDLRFIPAATVSAELDIESARQKMIARGVRALLVVNVLQDVIGIVTSSDFTEEWPAAVSLVRHIMTGAEHIEVLFLTDVLLARVGDIVATLKDSGRQHALVLEEQASSGHRLVCGIFSATQIARQLGIPTAKHVLSDTFSDIDRAMAAHP